MTKPNRYHHWQLKQEENLLWLYFDRKNKSANTINPQVLDELSAILAETAQQQIKGLIIASNKKSGFIAGADIEQFTQAKNSEAALAFIRKGQEVFNQLAALAIPTVAMIKGFCVGGGLELALACRYRIAEDSAKTRLGLPEVLLGIHPGWGGSVRLPRLIGAPQAMDLILTGRTVDTKTAVSIGFVDVAVPERHLERAARFYAQTSPRPHRATALQSLSNHSLIRPLIAKLLRNKVSQKARPEHYPAPYAAIANWEREGVDNQHAFVVEAESVSKLVVSDSAQNLVRDFFLRDRLKGLSKDIQFAAQHVHVVGAGTMGGDIAAWCALRGLHVTLQDREPKFIAPAIKRAYELFKKKLKTPRAIQEAMDRLMPDPNGLGVAQADVIIEAIFENLEAKQNLFKLLEAHAKPSAILATNTSSIPLDDINKALQNPGRLIGIHFFNPVAMMQLVEVVQGDGTRTDTLNNAIAFVKQLDKLPLPVRSKPGFLVNRILMPYLMEAVTMVDEGIPARDIDHAAKQFGMPMGPIELADTVGLDVCLAVAKESLKHFGGTIPAHLEKLVSDAKLGRKTGEGFYHYKNNKPVKEKNHNIVVTTSDISDRLILRMLNESVACLREQVISDADLLDAGMIFGTGFAPFRGGPLHYAKTRGINNIVAQLEQFTAKYGARFTPDIEWEKLHA
jgi:3-hydroxyacyl-CoA dehydrogenase/enoyl-CoA hydratase/3-hydroxybutyryl-CoA epimerase